MAREDNGRCDKCNVYSADLVACSGCGEHVCPEHRKDGKCISCIANG